MAVLDDPRPHSDAPVPRVLPSLPRAWRAPLVVLACLALAALSVAVIPSLPSYDPFSWLVWGREIAHQLIGPHESLIIEHGPSWKPLPMLFTTIFGFVGSAAPTLWMIFARGAGLVGIAVAYRLGATIGADARWRPAGPVAGVLSALAVCVLLGWANFMLRATSEPLTITATLLWVDWHRRGRRGWALAAGAALALMRPESAAFLAPYGLWCLWRGPGVWRRLAILFVLALIPLAWIGPPWLADGVPFESAAHARDYTGNRGHDLVTVALVHAEILFMWPVLAAALGLVLYALWHRERFVIALAVIALAYIGVVEVMTIHGYPGLSRFMLPPASLICVLAGAGVARLCATAGGGVRSALLAAVVVAVAVPLCAPRAADAATAWRETAAAARGDAGLHAAVRRLGGRHRMLPCTTSVVAVNHDEQPELAWLLDVPLPRIHEVTRATASLNRPALALFAHRTAALGGSPTRLLANLQRHLLFREGMWRVERITRRHDAAVDACVGGKRRRAEPARAVPRRRRSHGFPTRVMLRSSKMRCRGRSGDHPEPLARTAARCRPPGVGAGPHTRASARTRRRRVDRRTFDRRRELAARAHRRRRPRPPRVAARP